MQNSFLDFDLFDSSKKNAMKYIMASIITAVLIVCVFRASYWSFEQTLNFLRPAFQTAIEAIVFAIFIQYGPQPALFFVGYFKNKRAMSIRKRDQWIEKNRGNGNIPLNLIDDVFWNTVYMGISVLFFVGLSAIDFITNIGEVNNSRQRSAAGTINDLLYWVMISFAFFVLWAEELAGYLFVQFFVLIESLNIIFQFSKMSFLPAQNFFKKASAYSEKKNSGPTSTQLYREPSVQGRVTTPEYRPAPKPRPVASSSQTPRGKPTYHPVSYRQISTEDLLKDLNEIEKEDF